MYLFDVKANIFVVYIPHGNGYSAMAIVFWVLLG
jgi:hypothetical protein